MTTLNNKIQFIERTKCPVCSSDNILNILTTSYKNENFKYFLMFEETFKAEFWREYNIGYFNNQHFTVSECKDCKFIFQKSILGDDGLKRLYDKWIDPQTTLERHCNQNRLEKSRIFTQRLNIIMRHFSNLSNINVLDWGAGFGDFCITSLNTGVSVTALEFSNERRIHLEKRGITVVGIEQLLENHYHFINIDQVIEHIAQPIEFLNNIHKYLRDDGVLFIGAPNCKNVKQLAKKGILSQELYKYIAPLQHLNAFTNRTLKKACQNAHFKVLFPINPQPVLIYSTKDLFYSVINAPKNFGRPLASFFFNTSFFLKKSNMAR